MLYIYHCLPPFVIPNKNSYKTNFAKQKDLVVIVLAECNRSRLASLKFPFAITQAATVFAQMHSGPK